MCGALCRFFTAAVWCVSALRVPLVHSLINHFRQKEGQGPAGAVPVGGDKISAACLRFLNELALWCDVQMCSIRSFCCRPWGETPHQTTDTS